MSKVSNSPELICINTLAIWWWSTK